MAAKADELELDKALKKIDYSFRWTGMNLESSRKTRAENLKYKFIFFFYFILTNSDVAGAIGWFIDNALKGANFTTLTYAAPCVTFCFLANFKSFSMLFYENTINEILSILRNLETMHNQSKKNVEKQDIINKETFFFIFVFKCMQFFNWFLIISFPLMPLILTAIEYHNTNRIELQLPFRVLYPFDAYDIKYWPWIYLRQILENAWVILTTSGVDYLFYLCISFTCIQFKLLQHDLRWFITRDRFRGSLKTDLESKTRVIQMVKWHQQLIHAVQLLELIYAKSTLFNFFASSLLICLCGFNVVTVDDKPIIVSFVSFLFASFLQIFIMCYFGDLLKRSSIEVSDAIYNSNWYTADSRTKKYVYIIIMRAQKPCKLTAYGFADVNVGSFTAILSKSWSYFALLNTVYSPPRV